jgi:hypothetical protein
MNYKCTNDYFKFNCLTLFTARNRQYYMNFFILFSVSLMSKMGINYNKKSLKTRCFKAFFMFIQK